MMDARCERHIGDAHPPRCADCDTEQIKATAEALQRRLETNYPTYIKREVEHHA